MTVEVEETSRPLTRSDLMKHVLKDVLLFEESNPIFAILETIHVRSMPDLLALSEESIGMLFMKDKNNARVALPEGTKNTLKALKSWNYYLISNGYVMGKVDWGDVDVVNSESFDDYRVTDYDPDNPCRHVEKVKPSTPANRFPMSSDAAAGVKSPPSILRNFGSLQISAAQEFRKGIKRDKTHYKELKDEKFWDDWKRKTISTAFAHGCQQVLNTSYLPTTDDEIELFTEQQNFMYDVFNSCLLTDMGKHIVCEHEQDRDAQAVWRDYCIYMKTSTRADLEIDNLMTFFATARIDLKTNGGTASQFVLEWLNKMRLYEKITPTSAHFTEPQKKNYLQTALNNYKVFRDVKSVEQLDVAKGRAPMKYAEYVNLIQQVATTLDADLQRNKKRTAASRSVKLHDISPFDGTMYEANLTSQDDPTDYLADIADAYEPAEIDYLGSMSVHLTDQAKFQESRNPTLRKDVWHGLTRADQLAWDNLSASGKYAIIKSRAPNYGNPRNSTAPPTTTPARLTNVTEVVSPDSEIFHDAPQDLGTSDGHGDVHSSPDSLLINAAKQGHSSATPNAPHDVHRLLGTRPPGKAPSSGIPPVSKQITPPGHGRSAYLHSIKYNIMNNTNQTSRGALIDRGANGGMAGADTRIISRTDRHVDVTGIDNHELVGLPIVTAGATVPSDKGPIILIFHQYAYLPQGKTIHSSVQLEHFGTIVDDRSSKVSPPGTQSITTIDGYVLPLNFHNGLPYLHTRPFTDAEWDTLPHVTITSDSDWDPSNVDHSTLPSGDTWQDPPSNPTLLNHQDFDAYGSYTGISVSFHDWLHDTSSILTDEFSSGIFLQVNARNIQPSSRDYASLAPFFLNASPKVIEHTFAATTQYARSGWITGHIKQTYRSPFPALNVSRRNEPVATDTVFSDVPAIDGGATCAQVFVGLHSRFTSVYSMTSDSQFANTLMDVIRHHGAMDVLVSDSARSEMSQRVQNILRHLCIDDWQSEAHYQHQNYAERRYQNLKHNVNRVLNSTGAPAHSWFLCLRYVSFIMNRMALSSLQWRTPFEQLTGSTPDISMIYRFRFWDRVLFERAESRGGFPSTSDEDIGRFVGFSEHIGHPMIYIILTDDTKKIIYRSRIKLFEEDPNLRLVPHPSIPVVGTSIPNRTDAAPILVDGEGNRTADGESTRTSNSDDMVSHDHDQNDDLGEIPTVLHSRERPMAIIDPNDLIGRTFLSTPSDEGLRDRLKVVEALNDIENGVQQDPQYIRFRCVCDSTKREEIVSYNQLLDRLESPDGTTDQWRFKSIIGHEGPLKPGNKKYKGSRWNVKVEWEDGSITEEPLAMIGTDDPVTVAIYGKENNLLHLDGWKKVS